MLLNATKWSKINKKAIKLISDFSIHPPPLKKNPTWYISQELMSHLFSICVSRNLENHWNPFLRCPFPPEFQPLNFPIPRHTWCADVHVGREGPPDSFRVGSACRETTFGSAARNKKGSAGEVQTKTDLLTDGRTERQTDGRTDGRTVMWSHRHRD